MSALSILAEECELLNDSKYRSYITQVEKALKSFDSTSEWADLISALGKLNKVLLAHVKYPVIPKRVTIGKRLAQCLHPALPSGVHMKCLETYDIIFKCIGTERLSQDLFIYSAGLFPLLSYAAMNVKPILLMIYERHFVSLGLRIKPGLNGLLLGLLPGLEEGSEFFDHTNGLLEDFCSGTGPVYFYTCLWECIHSCPSTRLPAITFLLIHFNKKQSMEDQLDMMGLNINLMIEALCDALQDTSVLVQRSLLDFLMIAFPLHNSQLTHSDMAKVVEASVNVLLRRDMSLNRRLYAWLLGTSALGTVMRERKQGEGIDTESSYFFAYSKDLLVKALKRKLSEKLPLGDKGSVKHAVLKPFRIVISLLDKPEIGPVILENLLLSIFRCLHTEFKHSKHGTDSRTLKRHEKSDSDDRLSVYDELLKTANLLFATFEPFFIWDYAARMYHLACMQSTKQPLKRQDSTASQKDSSQESIDVVSITELCQLVSFLLDIVSLETFSETQTEHLPKLLCSIITSLSENCQRLTNPETIATIQLCNKLLSKVQPTMIIPGSHDELSHDLQGSHDQRLHEKVSRDRDSHAGSRDQLDVVEVSSTEIKQPEPVLSLEEALEMNKNLKSENNSQPDTSIVDNAKREEDKTTPAPTNNNTSKGGEHINKPEAKTGKQKPPLSRKTSRQNQSFGLMQKCIEIFQDFFHVLVRQKVLLNKELSDRCFESLMNAKDSETDDDYHDVSDDVVDSGPTINVNNCEIDAIDTFVAACHLLEEFASFPLYGEEDELQTYEDPDHKGLPPWVKDLLICSCHVNNFQIQTAAIASILDLVILTQSVNSEGEGHSRQNQSIAVKILPTLPNADLRYIEERTNFHERCVVILWSFLHESTPQYHFNTAKLFHILHQVSPTSWLCENVIGKQLVHEEEERRVDAFKKFAVLWHLTRNKRTGVIPGKPLRTFDRSMFVVLDSLKEGCTSTKMIATTWLTHVIQHGDISRVMEPLLLMLLHPDTARVSVQHVNINKTRKVNISESSEDNGEANIYAISSDGGNVIYHVGSSKDSIKPKPKEDLKSYALTVLSGGATSIASMRSRSVQELHFDKVDPNNLNLKINPFGSENSLDRLTVSGCDSMISSQELPLNKVKRLDRQTCLREGISFESINSGAFYSDEQKLNDGTDSNSVQMMSSCDSIDDSCEEVVRWIIDDIVENIVPDENTNENSRADVTPVHVKATRPLSLRSDSVTSSNPDHDLLNSMNHRESGVDSPTPSEQNVPIFQDVRQDNVDQETTDIHTLHMHMLLYTQKYDYQRTVYALSTLKSMLEACPRLLVTSLVTTSISSLRAPQLASLQLLLARHRKSVFGRNFFGEIPAEVMSNYRSSMFIEILISVCLYFIRGYYPNLMISKLTFEELLGNKQVHIFATETLTLIMSEVISIMRDSGKNFTSYFGDLLSKCKVQKALLHCVLAVIYNGRKKTEKETIPKITEAIVAFNEEGLDPSSNESFQIKLLNLLLILIMLEDQIGNTGGNNTSDSTSQMDWDRLKVNYQHSLSNIRYNVGNPIVQQGMFLSAVLSALKQHHLCHMHQHWLALITSSLPYMGRHLPSIIMTVVSQLCRNIEVLAAEYESKNTKGLEKIPPDHVITILNGLMTLCHYCLLDNISPVSIGQCAPSPLAATPTITSGSILTNLFNVFNPVGGSKETSPQRDLGAVSPVLDARTNLLSILPRIIAALTSMWHAMSILEGQEDSPKLPMGSPKTVRQYILEFISPISLPHGTHLLGAIAVAWNDRRKKSHIKHLKKVFPPPCSDQLLLVDLVSAIKVLPVDTLIQTVKQVLKQPPSSELSRTKKSVPLEVNLLQFFYAYVKNTAANQLLDSWSSLLVLLRESLQINLVPSGQFLLLLILNEFVQKTPTNVDKKHQKEIKEICHTLMEAVSAIAGSSLEQSTWLRKNYAVKPGVQSDEPDMEDSQTKIEEVQIPVRRIADLEPNHHTSLDSKYSVQALTLLAELTAPILDIIYSSEEKDKIATFLTSLLYNIFPYLKNHSSNNLPSLRAGSQFLASVSSYQYTRKAWRREALELLLDPSFFQMDVTCINFWVSIVDNLMTHDKTTYKDLMARVSTTQSASLNLFSNKEQEMDLKAGMLKRLSFTIFCSDSDQYQKSVPEIQEKLAESLRFPQAPSVMAQVFLTFRVLIMRISPQHLTSMWPTIITELIHVFLQVEQELSSETEEFVSKKLSATQVQRIAALDSSWAHLGNGLNAHSNPSWLQLYLSACKLLDLCLVLPADKVPQFQLYRWAFIGGASAGEGEMDMEEEEEDTKKKKKKESKHKRPSFKPHIIRLARLLNMKLQGDVPVMKLTHGRPLLTFTYLRSLTELQPFFNTLCLANQTDNLLMAARHIGADISEKQPNSVANGHANLRPDDHFERSRGTTRGMPKSRSAPLMDGHSSMHAESTFTAESDTEYIEEIIKRDFLEQMP